MKRNEFNHPGYRLRLAGSVFLCLVNTAGADNLAYIDQEGDQQTALVFQSGAGNQSSIEQMGFTIELSSVGSFSQLSQTGLNNNIGVTYASSDKYSNVVFTTAVAHQII